MYNDSNYLAHYGVLGMRWGIRRAERRNETLSKRGMYFTKKRAEKAKTTREAKIAKMKSKLAAKEKNLVKNMSDDELRKRINRLQMEKQYSSLNPTTIGKGKQIAQKVIMGAATGAATGLLTAFLAKGMKLGAASIAKGLGGVAMTIAVDGVVSALNRK
jgi:hypothetical protein